MYREEIRNIVREVLKEKGLSDIPANKPISKRVKRPQSAPAVLNVFHAGVRKLEQALEQVGQIEKAASRSSVYTATSARAWVCGTDVKEKAGVRCILDTVKPEGLEKALEKSDILVLPTFCLKTAAKVASLICDDLESSFIFTALLQGKKILATRDSFLFCDLLVNEKLKEEIERIFKKLEGFGIVICTTDQLYSTFQKMMATDEKLNNHKNPQSIAIKENKASAAKMITAKAINLAVSNKQGAIVLPPKGIVSPLARDIAKEHGIKIIET